jgi:hypothetical protein
MILWPSTYYTIIKTKIVNSWFCILQISCFDAFKIIHINNRKVHDTQVALRYLCYIRIRTFRGVAAYSVYGTIWYHAKSKKSYWYALLGLCI